MGIPKEYMGSQEEDIPDVAKNQKQIDNLAKASKR